MSTKKLKNGMIECYFKEFDVKYVVASMNEALLIGMALGYYKKFHKN